MQEIDIFQRKRYYRNTAAAGRSDRTYFKRVENGKSIYLHRAIWEHHNGPIPKGFHVHHKDGNAINNAIENLECLSVNEHLSIEHGKRTKEWLDRNKIHLAKFREKAAAWHASEEGLEWHRKNGIEAWKKFVSTKKSCKQCDDIFDTKSNHDMFCSNACKSAWRRASGLDDIAKTCEHCKDEFFVNKYKKTRYCSVTCRADASRKVQTSIYDTGVMG